MARPSISTALAGVGVAGALLGAAAVGAAAGAFGERYALRKLRKGADPLADQPFGTLPADEIVTVHTADGIELHAEIVAPKRRRKAGAAERGKPAPTVVFVHGFCLDMGTWHFQRQALSENPGTHRMVFYDQPGHGRSGRRPAGDYSLDQLAEDLHTVLAAVAPKGPLVLVGHSMGGMVLMAFAQRYPKLFADRVVGVALLSTSAGHLDQVALGLPRFVARLRKPLMPTIAGTLKTHPRLGELGRASGSDLSFLLTRHFAFGSTQPSRALTEYVEKMNAATAVEVIAGYLGTLSEHDRYAALDAFSGIETLVICGDKDLLTPVQHTREIARLVPNTELVEIADGGHLALMEHPEVVNRHLAEFLARASRAAAV